MVLIFLDMSTFPHSHHVSYGVADIFIYGPILLWMFHLVEVYDFL